MSDANQRPSAEDDEFVNEDVVEVVEEDPEQDDEDDLVDGLIEVEMDDVIDALQNEIDEEEREAREAAEQDKAEPLCQPLETIEKHQGAVFCLDSFKNYFATGGEDDLGMLWQYDIVQKKLDLLLTTEKFKDSVTNIKFSADGKYVAMADMGGLIRVYAVDTKELHWSHDLESDIEALDWHPGCNVLFASTADGYFYMLKISTNEIKLMYAGDNASLSNFKILRDGKRAVCCYNNGCVRIWDLKSTQAVHSFPSAHKGVIIAVDVSADGNLVATAGVDMKVHLVNTTNGKFIANLVCEEVRNKRASDGDDDDDVELDEEEERENSIESLAFSKSLPLLACASIEGKVYVWDLNTQSLRASYANDNGVGYTKLAWANGSSGTLYASTVDGSFQSFDARSNLKAPKRLRCHHEEIFDFNLDASGNLLYTASNDNSVKIFDLTSQS